MDFFQPRVTNIRVTTEKAILDNESKRCERNPDLHRRTCPTPHSSSLERSSCAFRSPSVEQKKGPVEGKGWSHEKQKQQREVGASPMRIPPHTHTHLSGHSLLGNGFEGVNHGDVAESPGDRQSAVPILENTANTARLGHLRSGTNSRM